MAIHSMKLPVIGALAAAILVGCAANAESNPAPVAMAPASAPAHADPRASLLAGGYLPRGVRIDSLLINPAPPTAGSAAFARDEEAARASFALRGTPRWEQAKIDADIFSPKSTDTFSCAAGIRIGADTTPKLNALMRKVGPDLGLASYPTKLHYKRPRPFMLNGEPTCTPQDEAMLRKDGSYPSGHSAIGYGWGLILSEVIPDRVAQLIARGRSFGVSRSVCNVHWLSDVEEGRQVATAVFARLQSEPAFLADVAAARDEVAAQRTKLPAPDCARENAALGLN